ncbi:restriction endonuclease, SacI family [Chloroflexus sp.]|uniref:restriction endonuclease, SacI family n=1 Tax=Chloroflexus sp. TaxID=1904827 RepID=UPI00298F01A9|nr:restriction endonuclease, SacI family [Chloroflexus sp.]MDW8404341.1 DNA methyltransferase [Chloroflexus sp.]
MSTPDKILESILEQATKNLNTPVISDPAIRFRVEYVCRLVSNRACARLLMACLLAKIDRPDVDPRKPYTAIGDPDAFSGRSYDEKFITRFIYENRLPLNSTTAFLTPAFRNLDKPLTTDLELVGRPRRVYKETLQLLDDVYQSKITAEELLTEVIRILLLMRQENEARIHSLLAGFSSDDSLPLSSEEIVSLIEQHLKCKNSSRLPVLIVAAAYNAIGKKLGEYVLPLQSHNAADQQTGSLGDVEICLENDSHVVTVYEMKTKQVTIDDINRALEKIASAKNRIHNYIFITTDVVSDEVKSYAAGCYEKTYGTEIAVLDCIGFLRHFLHFFHRSRAAFLDAYQYLVLNEPDSAVSRPLKEVFLALRQSAEADRE